MDSAELIALAERCEAADGPERGLDAEIQLATGRWSAHHHEAWVRFQECGECVNPPMTTPVCPSRYTASLDAAMQLAPDFAHLTTVKELWNTGDTGTGKSAMAIIARYGATMWTGDFTGLASTPALALCAATLRARAAMENNHD